MAEEFDYEGNPNIPWYRCPLERETLRALTQRSDLRAFAWVVPHFAAFFVTAALAYCSFRNWPWYVTVLTVYLHGTMASFMGMAGPGHELTHGTVFRTRFWNTFFVHLYCFLSWSSFASFYPSHMRHHAVTVFRKYDGEVVLPRHVHWRDWLTAFTCSPLAPLQRVWGTLKTAAGRFEGLWARTLFAAEKHADRRRQVVNWARILLIGHALLAAVFVLTGHWFLIVLITFPWFCAGWLAFLVGHPQHAGMQGDVPDFRLSCRTFLLNPVARFLYWNMNYHVEHHMYAAVPFYNLPKLHDLIADDLPEPNPNTLAAWRELLAIQRRQEADPSYVFVRELPTRKAPTA